MGLFSAIGDALSSFSDPIGSLISAGGSMLSSSAANSFNEKMSNTSYQRGVADMKKAGLNPMLAYGAGGASTPQYAQPNIPDLGAAVSRGRGSALQAAQTRTALAQAHMAELDSKNSDKVGFNVTNPNAVGAFAGLTGDLTSSAKSSWSQLGDIVSSMAQPIADAIVGGQNPADYAPSYNRGYTSQGGASSAKSASDAFSKLVSHLNSGPATKPVTDAPDASGLRIEVTPRRK